MLHRGSLALSLSRRRHHYCRPHCHQIEQVCEMDLMHKHTCPGSQLSIYSLQRSAPTSFTKAAVLPRNSCFGLALGQIPKLPPKAWQLGLQFDLLID